MVRIRVGIVQKDPNHADLIGKTCLRYSLLDKEGLLRGCFRRMKTWQSCDCFRQVFGRRALCHAVPDLAELGLQ